MNDTETSETLTSHRTVCAHLHVVGETGSLPRLVEAALAELITLNGRATQALLSLAKNGLVLRRDKEENLIAAELTLPCRKNKYADVAAKAGEPILATRINNKGKLVTKKWYGEGNSYHIVRFTPETGMFTVRVFDRYAFDEELLHLHSEVVFGSDLPKGIKAKTDSLPANFLQAVFTSFLELPFQGFPDIVVKPAMKQAAEQLLSYVQLEAGENQQAEYPDTNERDPELRLVEWQKSLHELSVRTEPFEFVRARDIDYYAETDRRGNRFVNITPEWTKFAESPFARRLPLKIPPEFCILLRRKTEGHAKIPNRIYLGLQIFDGVTPDSTLGVLATAEDGKLFWWHDHLDEFSNLEGKPEPKLKNKPQLLMVSLEYDREQRFEESVGGDRKICLVTLKETRNFRRGRHGHTRTDRLPAGNTLWRADFATSAEVAAPKWNGRILGIHFQHNPVITWALMDHDAEVLEKGFIEGNAFLGKALDKQALNEYLQKGGKWVGDRSFGNKLKGITHTLASLIVRLAREKDAWIALEEISWVQKQSADSVANRRFSMWNYSRLATLIEWLGTDIATRDCGTAAPLAHKVSDYLTHFTCPECGACRKAGQKKEIADTVRAGDILTCRKCGFSGPIPDNFIAEFVAKKALERMLKKKPV
ncbi:MAG: hypothetical protein A3A22_04235 [Candidatus Taylorbacteria bacterium RIFCSPLOWO2_01_FULL_45_34b]|nr:MAG: hypothetical protein A3A22_04235 [Candidatus Taylorbacteria bacterium RIFCSPLOWO2_01_FULL_45_34b]QBM02335.1 CRISPR-associated protein Cas14d.3 [uncultured archaeon]